MHASANPIETDKARPVRAPLSTALRDALLDGQLTAVFQPIVAPHSRAVIGVEILSRWTHPDLGAVPPTVFVPHLARLGLSERFDSWMLQLACEALTGAGSSTTTVPIHVNLSPHTLTHDGAAARLLAVVAQHDVMPEQVCFELVNEAELSTIGIQQVAVLRAAGSRVAVDDFVAGPDSRERLQQLDVDQVKLDLAITMALSGSAVARAAALSAVDIAAEFGIEVVAVGVGSVAQERLLLAMGVDALQGFLFGRPIASFDEATRGPG